MKTANANAARKIARAHRLGWHRALLVGPCRWITLGATRRRSALRAVAAKVDNRWNPSPAHLTDTETEAAA